MKRFFEDATQQDHPLRTLKTFLEQEKANELAKKYDDMRFVGYALEIGFDTVTPIRECSIRKQRMIERESW